MHTYHEFDHEGRHYRFVHDELHETRGSYAYDTEEETKAAEDNEIEKLESGEWVVLGCIVTEPCTNPNHCDSCNRKVEVDSLWGIVVENSTNAIERFAKECM